MLLIQAVSGLLLLYTYHALIYVILILQDGGLGVANLLPVSDLATPEI